MSCRLVVERAEVLEIGGATGDPPGQLDHRTRLNPNRRRIWGLKGAKTWGRGKAWPPSGETETP